jgi:hypothetical protein
MNNLKIHILYIGLFIFIHFSATSQSSFEVLYGSTDWSEYISDSKEDQFGNFYLTGYKCVPPGNSYCGLIIKLNSNGKIINQIQFCHPDSSFFTNNIKIFNDSIFIFGSKKYNENNRYFIWSLLLDPELNVIKNSTYNTPTGTLNFGIQSVLYLKANFILLTNNVMQEDSLYRDIGFFVLDKNLDSTNSKVDARPFYQAAFDFIPSFHENGYKVFGFGIFPGAENSYGKLLEFDSTFTFNGADSLPYRMNNQFSAKLFNDSTYLLAGKKGMVNPIKYDVGIIKMSIIDQMLQNNHFGKGGDTNNYTGVRNSVDFIFENNIYLGGTSNFISNQYPWQTDDSWIMLNNLDSNLDLNWQMYYGGDAFYHLRGLIATKDGGCLMYASRYDENTQFQEYDVYILKVDSAGLLTSTGEVPHIPVQQLAIVPNPARDIVSIRYPDIFGYDDKEIEVYNSQGLPVISLSATQDLTETRVDVSALPAGLYFVVLKLEGKKVGTGKMVEL